MTDDDIERLIDEYGEETVRKSFWLQQHIYEQGIEGIHFSRKAEKAMNKTGPMLVHKAINDQFNGSI